METPCFCRYSISASSMTSYNLRFSRAARNLQASATSVLNLKPLLGRTVLVGDGCTCALVLFCTGAFVLLCTSALSCWPLSVDRLKPLPRLIGPWSSNSLSLLLFGIPRLHFFSQFAVCFGACARRVIELDRRSGCRRFCQFHIERNDCIKHELTVFSPYPLGNR